MEKLHKKNLEELIKKAVSSCLSYVGSEGLPATYIEDVVTEDDFVPDKAISKSYQFYWVINLSGISLWFFDLSGHGNHEGIWRKRPFESLEEYVVYATNQALDATVEANTYHLLREAFYDKPNYSQIFFRKTKKDLYFKNIKKTKKEIMDNLVKRRKEYFLSSEFLNLDSAFKKQISPE